MWCFLQISSYIQALDKQLNLSLNETGNNTSDFSWYLALQVISLEPYNAKNGCVIEHKLPYDSMNMLGAPKPSLYTEDKHVTQYEKQNANLHLCEKPSILIQFYNNLQPHSLHYLKEEQKLPDDVVKNTSILVQNSLKTVCYEHQLDGLNENMSQGERQLDSDSNMVFLHNDAFEPENDFPVSEFVEATFTALRHAIVQQTKMESNATA
jgi:hypothetical protein